MEEYKYFVAFPVQSVVHVNTKVCLPEGTEQVLQCLHQDVFYLLSVCGGEYNLLFSICWGSIIRATDSKKLKKMIKKAGSVLGTAKDPIMEKKKLPNRINNAAELLHNILIKQ